jgi:hypothetical protein
MNERQLHEQVCAYLNLSLPFPDAFWTTFPADGATRRGRIGLHRGFPDILIIYARFVFGLELKTNRGRLSDVQVGTHAHLEQAGCSVEVAHSLDEVVAILAKWRIPTRTKLN